jgi:hypothetical protein
MRLIKDNPMLSDKQLAEIIGINRNQVRTFRKRYGMNKSEQFMQMVRTNNLALGGGRPVRKSLHE